MNDALCWTCWSNLESNSIETYMYYKSILYLMRCPPRPKFPFSWLLMMHKSHYPKKGILEMFRLHMTGCDDHVLPRWFCVKTYHSSRTHQRTHRFNCARTGNFPSQQIFTVFAIVIEPRNLIYTSSYNMWHTSILKYFKTVRHTVSWP